MAIRLVVLGFAILLSACGNADTTTTASSLKFNSETVASGLEHPWSLAFLPDGEILLTERPGRLRSIVNNQLNEKPVSGAPKVAAHGQGGLLDVLLHPDFSDNRLIYLSYALPCPSGGNTTAVGRGEYRDGALHNFKQVIASRACGDKGQHYAGRMVFDQQGYLYLSIGDRGERDRAQNGKDHAGSILRLHDDGSIPQ
ncbi:PQQ-dependent sugar dehydrogenase, partial [Alcanivorax sp. 1008]|uniref:PQQ-dependent sugar dehydrogenase n=1 Tax=Alcanivorax sp. 1008 TaxID=2816853 RepID=UPI001D4CDEA0